MWVCRCTSVHAPCKQNESANGVLLYQGMYNAGKKLICSDKRLADCYSSTSDRRLSIAGETLLNALCSKTFSDDMPGKPNIGSRPVEVNVLLACLQEDSRRS